MASGGSHSPRHPSHVFTILATRGARKQPGPAGDLPCKIVLARALHQRGMPSERLDSMTPPPVDKDDVLLREARDAADRLRLILDINNTIAAHLELQDLLHAVAASLRRALQCDAAAITVADTRAGCLRFHAVDFPESIGVARPGYVMPIEGTLLGDVFRTAKPTLHSLADGIGDDEVAGPEGIRFGCVVPLFSRDRTIGVLSVGRKDAPAFTARDLDLLVQVSTQVAIALDNSMAWGKINDLKSQLVRSLIFPHAIELSSAMATW